MESEGSRKNGGRRSLEKLVERFLDRSDANDPDPEEAFQPESVRRRKDDLLEAYCLGFASPDMSVHCASHLTRQANFAENYRVGINWRVPKARGDRCDDSQVGG